MKDLVEIGLKIFMGDFNVEITKVVGWNQVWEFQIVYILSLLHLSRKSLDLHRILVAHISVAGGPKLQDKMERVLALLWNKDECMDKYSSLLVDCNQDLHTLVLGSVFIKFMASKQADVSKVRITWLIDLYSLFTIVLYLLHFLKNDQNNAFKLLRASFSSPRRFNFSLNVVNSNSLSYDLSFILCH